MNFIRFSKESVSLFSKIQGKYRKGRKMKTGDARNECFQFCHVAWTLLYCMELVDKDTGPNPIQLCSHANRTRHGMGASNGKFVPLPWKGTLTALKS